MTDSAQESLRFRPVLEDMADGFTHGLPDRLEDAINWALDLIDEQAEELVKKDTCSICNEEDDRLVCRLCAL